MSFVAVAFALLAPASMSITSPRPPAVVVVPFGNDVASRALFEAVQGAVPAAAVPRGLSAVRADAVKPVHEALARCGDDACRVTQARRLGARWVVLGTPGAGGLTLRLLDVEGAEKATALINGAPPEVMGRVPLVMDGLLEQVAPLAAHRRQAASDRAVKARIAGDLEAADGALAEAIGVGALDDDAAELWLSRVRMWDQSGDGARARATWDAFAAALVVAAPPLVDDDTRGRMRAALRDHLLARATWQLDAADADLGPDHAALLMEAAHTHLSIAGLFPEERARALFSAAELFRDAGRMEEARHLYDEVQQDPTADDELKVRALARARL